jgi:chaperonin GroES
MARLQPIGDRVIVRPATIDDVSAGGIHIPDVAKEKPKQGTVIAVGASVDGIVEGNVVMFGQWTGTEVVIDGEKLLIMKVTDVLCIIRE